jgi:hypothetical protein
MLFEDARGPNSELGGTHRIDSISDGYNGIQAVLPSFVLLTMPGHMFQNGTGALFVQLPAFVDIAQMLGNGGALGAKQIGHLRLGQPERIGILCYLKPYFAVGRGINLYLLRHCCYAPLMPQTSR